MQMLGHNRGNQRVMFDVEQVIHDKPHRLLGGHPVLTIETLQIDGNRKTPQRPLAAQIDVSIEIGQRQFAQGSVDGLPPAASRVIRFGHGPPASVLPKDGDYVVGVVLGLKIK